MDPIYKTLDLWLCCKWIWECCSNLLGPGKLKVVTTNFSRDHQTYLSYPIRHLKIFPSRNNMRFVAIHVHRLRMHHPQRRSSWRLRFCHVRALNWDAIGYSGIMCRPGLVAEKCSRPKAHSSRLRPDGVIVAPEFTGYKAATIAEWADRTKKDYQR